MTVVVQKHLRVFGDKPLFQTVKTSVEWSSMKMYLFDCGPGSVECLECLEE